MDSHFRIVQFTVHKVSFCHPLLVSLFKQQWEVTRCYVFIVQVLGVSNNVIAAIVKPAHVTKQHASAATQLFALRATIALSLHDMKVLPPSVSLSPIYVYNRSVVCVNKCVHAYVYVCLCLLVACTHRRPQLCCHAYDTAMSCAYDVCFVMHYQCHCSLRYRHLYKLKQLR